MDQNSTGLVIRPLDQPGDLGWVVLAHGEVYAQQLNSDATFEAYVAQVVAEYGSEHDPEREAGWIAELDGQRVGCVLCVAADEPDTAQLRLLVVLPETRGRGAGSQLVDECVRFAKAAGQQRIVLWTNDTLASARRIYEAAGFTLADAGEQHEHGHPLVGQAWELTL